MKKDIMYKNLKACVEKFRRVNWNFVEIKLQKSDQALGLEPTHKIVQIVKINQKGYMKNYLKMQLVTSQ